MNPKPHHVILAFLAAAQCVTGQITNIPWGPARNNVKMSIMATSGSSHFYLDDLNDLPGFISHLTNQSEPLATFLWQRLTKKEQLLLTNYNASAPSANHVHKVVVSALNKIIDGPSIYTTERLKTITLPKETRATMENAIGFDREVPASAYVSIINHLLLKDAYPMQLSPKPFFHHATIKLGDQIILRIAFTNMSANEIFRLGTARNIVDDPHYSFRVLSPSGSETSPKGDYMRIRSSQSYVLDTDKWRQQEFNFNISAICKFDELGIYSITATRQVSWPDGKEPYFVVVSNPLTLEIVSDK